MARYDAAVDEVTRLGAHAWAGEYRCSAGLNASVRIVVAPDTGIVYAKHGCTGLSDSNQGAVMSYAKGVLAVEFEKPLREDGDSEFVSDGAFAVVYRGLDRYLVPISELPRLIDFHRGGGFDLARRTAYFPALDGKESARVSDMDPAPLLIVPSEYRRLAERGSPIGSVVAIEPGPMQVSSGKERRTLIATIDIGAETGLVADMTIYYGHTFRTWVGRVESVEDSSARVRFVERVREVHGGVQTPKTGDKVSPNCDLIFR